MSIQDKINLSSLSPLDGRYYPKTLSLRAFFSEAAFIKFRIYVETLYLIELSKFLKIEKLSKSQEKKLIDFAKNLSNADCLEVKKIEQITKHDVKAIEYFIKKNLQKLKLQKLSYLLHWGLTSEDVNNLAYSLMLKEAKEKVIIPLFNKLLKKLLVLANQYRSCIMPGRTHGQIAVPTTVGKELLVFSSRINFFLVHLKRVKFGGKLNGAVGNYNCQEKLFPKLNWLKFSQKFVTKLGLEPIIISTQIEPGYLTIYFLGLLRQLNQVCLNLCRDCWFYIALDYFSQKIKAKEVGSSTMPHKVNPIDFENGEGNLEISNSLILALENKLASSRLQRDLSDSTVKRNYGAAFGYLLIGITSLFQGLEQIAPNVSFLRQEVENHPEMMTEALQLQLKLWGQPLAYEEVKDKVRGRKINWLDLVKQLNITKEQKKKISNWQVKNYFGLAQKLVEGGIK